MGMKPVRPCLHRGCVELTRASYCPRHAALHARRRLEGGGTGARGTSGEWRRARLMALIRDAYRCTCCGAVNGLEVHHADGDPSNNVLGNLTTLCVSCHDRQHKKRARGG